MKHDLFGKLKYKGGDWLCEPMLPSFAAVGQRPEPPPPSPEEAGELLGDLAEALQHLEARIKTQFGEAGAKILGTLEQEVARYGEEADEPDPKAEARERKQAELAAKQAASLARGDFPVYISDPDKAGPSEQQEAAFRHLLAEEVAVFRAVATEVFDSFNCAYSQEHWRRIAGLKAAPTLEDLAGQYAIERVEIYREHHNGTSYLVFVVDAAWEDDHGLLVVYHPDKLAAWTTYDGLYELTASDEPVDDEEDDPAEQLFWAAREGDDARVRELLAAGGDLNAAADPDDDPPLLFAVENLEPEFVRRLLQYGADPNVTRRGRKTTPLKLARRMYSEYGFGGTKKRDPLLGAMLDFAQEASPGPMAKLKAQLDEIIQLLEAAGGT